MMIVLSAALFSLGFYGVLSRRDLVAVLAAVEVMLTGVFVFVASAGAARAALPSQVTLLVFLTLAAAEAVVGIALVLGVVRRAGLERVDELGEVQG
jgi:NADH:ubiquinone oxidoreductase subunit K